MQTPDLQTRVAKLERESAIVRETLDALAGRFAIFWKDEREGCLALVSSRRGDKADLFVMGSYSGGYCVAGDKEIIKTSKESKAGKWEPLVNPHGIIEKLDQLAQQIVEKEREDTAFDSVNAVAGAKGA